MRLTYEQSLKHFLDTFDKSKQMGVDAGQHIPGSYSRGTFNYGPHGIYIDHAEGAYIYTVEGRKLLDLNNNFTVNVFGYKNPAIDEAIHRTMEKGFSLGNPTTEEIELARILIERIPSMEQVKFFCSASEACMGALRIARGYTGRKKIAKMEGGYHGFIDSFAFSAHPDPNKNPGGIEKIRPLPESGGIPEDRAEDIVLLTQNNLEVSEKVIRETAAELACVILELQAGAGGIVVLDKDYVKRIREITNELGIVLIFDETVSIRACRGALQSQYEVIPDLTVAGKTVGGGLPLGVVGGSRKIMSVVENKTVKMSGTHHGHRIACAAGAACMNQLDQAAYEHLNGMAERIKKEINGWAKKNGYPFYVFGLFSVLAYVFTKKFAQKIHTHRDYWDKADSEKMQTYALEMAVRGFYLVDRGQLGLTVPMTDEDITAYIENTKEVVTAIYEEK